MKALALALTLLAISGRAEADSAPIKVAVIPGLAVNVDSTRVDALGQDLADALAAELVVEAAGGLEVRRQLPVEGLPPDCIADQACIADVARRVGAPQLLFIVVLDAGGGAVQIDSTWVEASSGKSASRPGLVLPPGSDPKSRLASAARALLPDAPVRPKPKTGVDGKMTPAVPRHFTTTTKITAGVAVIGLGVGIGFGLSARSKFGECDVEFPGPTCVSDSYKDALFRRTIVADIGFAVGIAGAVATGVLFMTSGKESRLVVEPSPQGVAVSAVGRF
ncbi:MAG TPA: hypothetical protein VK932_27890 [Kofleriaceae bacterium]|nr:hypothetical protein [Kofleriaceae bacterium]